MDNQQTDPNRLAVVTGASTGIGYHLAKCCAQDGFDLVVVADEPEIERAAADFRQLGVHVESIEADLATVEGVDQLLQSLGNRPVDALLANAGRGLGHAFLDQDFDAIRRVIDTNITGTVYLLHQLLPRMRDRGQGRVLLTGSVAGVMPGMYHAVYNATKSFIDSLSIALRAELEDSGVSISCLLPGPTETKFFERAQMMDTRVGQAEKDDPQMVARKGFEAMMKGKAEVVAGFANKVQAAAARVMPVEATAKMHGKLAEPQAEG